MRLLICSLLMLCYSFTTAQNVGINTATPQKTLHLNGELKVDSAAYLRKVYLKDVLDSTRMVLDPDNGAMEFWDNDTLWYKFQVSSPPFELQNGGNYTVERDWGNDWNGEPAIVTTYKNAAGEVVRVNREVVVHNPDEDDDLVVNEVFEDGCVAERTTQHGISGGTTREIFDCPSGTLCLKEETFTNNSTLNSSLATTTVLTDVKNGKELSNVTSGQTNLGNFIANKKFIATTVAGSQLLGGSEFQIDTCTSLNIYGKNNEGFLIKVSDLFVNPLPGLQLHIDEDNKSAAFCNTTELEQKIDNTLRRRGILDNALGTFSSRIQTPSAWFNGSFTPSTGLFVQSSSQSIVSFSRLYVGSQLETLVSGPSNTLRCTYQPAFSTQQFSISSSPIVMEMKWDTPNVSFIREVRNSTTNSKYTMTTVPSQQLMAHSTGSSIIFTHKLDTMNKIYTKTVEEINSTKLLAATFDPLSSSMIHDAGADLRMQVQFDELNNQLVSRVENGGTGAEIFSWMQPELLPAQSIWQVGSNQNNLDISFLANLNLQGILSKLAGSFKIDHPLDPYNKYLVHSFVESPDMMNIYNGNVVTDKDGMAIIELPTYFDALNIEPRYQLTVIGSFDQAIVFKEVENNQFSIKTSSPEVKVSWQVTGIRNDTFAKENRLVPEVDKKEKKGTLLYTPSGS